MKQIVFSVVLIISFTLVSFTKISSPSFKPWWVIAVNDAMGAYAGFEIGGKVGALAGPQGAAIGAGAGLVIGGAAASIGASRTAPNINPIIPPSPRNPFDQYGRMHNNLVIHLHNTGINKTDYTSIFEESKNFLAGEFGEILQNGDLKTALSETFTTYGRSLGSNYDLSIIQDVVNKSTLSINAKSALNQFFSDLPNYANGESFYSFITNTENGIIDSNSFSQSDKESILIVLAVYRYSYGLWSN